MSRLAARSLPALCALALAAGCTTTQKAPVVDRAATARPPAAAARPAPPAERPETYVVKRGDTLYSIALDNGLDYRELAEWNGITDPHVIQAGQELRLRAPETVVQVQPASGAGAIESRPLGADVPPSATPLPAPAPSPAPAARAPGQPPLVTAPKAQKLPWSEDNVALLARADAAAAQSQAPALATAPGASRPELAKPAPVPAPAPAPQASQGSDDGADRVDWVWPATGKVLAGFSDASNKGVDIAGKVGDPVFASAGGRVVYSGQGLRGYGKLIIIKHNNTYLSAYAHNSNLLVKEGQSVVRGQKIAEIGKTDSTQAKLHFEIRRLGKPIDPAKLLPERP